MAAAVDRNGRIFIKETGRLTGAEMCDCARSSFPIDELAPLSKRNN
jgi:hypothetical protein